MAFVYLITNTLDGKRYVGRTSGTVEGRWAQHRRAAERGDDVMLVARALRCHGIDSFRIEALEECDDSCVGERERSWIERLGTHVSMGGYNLTFGGDGGLLGHVHSEESRQKMRDAATGRRHTPETLEKMRRAKLGSKQDPGVVERRRQKLLGKKRTPEQVAKIAAGNRGKKRGDVARANIAAANRLIGLRNRQPIELIDDAGQVLRSFSWIEEAAVACGVSRSTVGKSIRMNMPIMGLRFRRGEHQGAQPCAGNTALGG